MSAFAAGGLLGGLGGGVANVVFAPLISATNFLSSYWYGAGLILGERQMYTSTWPEVKKRMDNGESFDNVIGSYIDSANATVAKQSKAIMDDLIQVFSKVTQNAINDIIQQLDVLDLIPEFGVGSTLQDKLTAQAKLNTEAARKIAEGQTTKTSRVNSNQSTIQQKQNLETFLKNKKTDSAEERALNELSKILASMSTINALIKQNEQRSKGNPASRFFSLVSKYKTDLKKKEVERDRWFRAHRDLADRLNL